MKPIKRFLPLYRAAEKGHVDVAKLLIKAGAIVNQASKDGESPLYIAASNGHVDLVKVIIEAGGDVNQAKRQPIACTCAVQWLVT